VVASDVSRAPDMRRGLAARASGLALAVRPTESAEAPRARVGPEDAFCGAIFAKWLERIFGCPCGWRGRPGQTAAFRPGVSDFPLAIGAPDGKGNGLACCWRARHREVRRGPHAAGNRGAVRGSRRARRAVARRGASDAAAPQRRIPG
jgi:hypothetical protein